MNKDQLLKKSLQLLLDNGTIVKKGARYKILEHEKLLSPKIGGSLNGEASEAKMSPKKKIVPNVRVINSLFHLLPPEIGVEVIKGFDLRDLNALFEAYSDLRWTYLPFLKSLSMSLASRSTGVPSSSKIRLPSTFLSKYLSDNDAVKSLTIEDGGGLKGSCRQGTRIGLAGLRSRSLESLRIINAGIDAFRSSLPRVKTVTLEWNRPNCSYGGGGAHRTCSTLPVIPADRYPNLEKVVLVNYELDWEIVYNRYVGDNWERRTLDLSRSTLSVPTIAPYDRDLAAKMCRKLDQLVEGGRIILGKVIHY